MVIIITIGYQSVQSLSILLYHSLFYQSVSPLFVLMSTNAHHNLIPLIMSSLMKGSRHNAAYGFGHVIVNGLTVSTFTMRVRKHSDMHMAFWYSTNVSAVIPIDHKDSVRAGKTYVTYRFATTGDMSHVHKAWVDATELVMLHKIAKLRGNYETPEFIKFFGAHNNDNLMDLPF